MFAQNTPNEASHTWSRQGGQGSSYNGAATEQNQGQNNKSTQGTNVDTGATDQNGGSLANSGQQQNNNADENRSFRSANPFYRSKDVKEGGKGRSCVCEGGKKSKNLTSASHQQTVFG